MNLENGTVSIPYRYALNYTTTITTTITAKFQFLIGML